MTDNAQITTAESRQPIIKTHFLYNPPDAGLHCHAASLAQRENGDLIAAWYAYPEEEHKDAIIVTSTLATSQFSWSNSRRAAGGEGSSAGNPVIYEAPDGSLRLHYVLLKGGYWNTAELMSSVSVNDGRNWTPPARMWPNPGMMVRHRPVVLEDGSLLLPCYEEKYRRSVLLKSRVPYLTWEMAYEFEGLELIQPDLIRRADGTLAMYFRPWTEPRVMWRTHSNDEGMSWGVPVRTPLPNPLSGLAAFPVGSATAVVYNHTEEHQRHPLSISVTHDGGLSWNAPWHIDTAEFEISYPSFLATPEGTIHGVYTYNRRLIKHISFDGSDLG